MGADGSLNFDTKISTDGFASGVNKLGSIAKTGMKVLSAAVIGGVTAFGALTKTSLDSVASLEQNVGGIETLFGAGGKSLEEYAESVGKSTDEAKEKYEQLMEAQTLALENANRAYETAGLSANEYMSTVTSFAASLKQSVANEVEAAKVADQAVIDMSDNANKMGTSMELIQNAYQGFAKQNYTMLDNLKLGYGGTKTEMQRLLKDAEKLTGIKYDINNLADVYNAIHVIQEELGITETTAKEAVKTIEGSMNMAKAAWDNFLNGTGTAEEFADAVGIATENIMKNLAVIVPRLVASIPKAVSGIGKELIETFKGNDYVESGLALLDSIIQGIEENIPIVIEKAGDLVSNLIAGIQESAPGMITTAAEMISSFAEGIGQQLPELLPKALEMLVTVADGIISNIPVIVDSGIALLKGLAQGIINSLPLLIAEVPRVINSFADAIYSGLGELLKAGWEMIKSLAQGLWDNRKLILENAGEIFMAILNVFSLSKLLSLGKGLLTNLVKGFKALASNPASTMKEILANAIKAVKNMDWANLGKNIISGIITGIKKNATKIISTLVATATAALDNVKEFLGIKSPSRRFRDEVGKMMALGMGIGFEDNIPTEDMQDSINNSVKKINKSVGTMDTVGSMEKVKTITTASDSSGNDNTSKEIIIHTHVDLDGKEVGYSITPYVDNNLSDNEDLKNRGN